MTNRAKYRAYSKIEEFLHNFYSLSQTAKIHNETHTLVIEGLEKFSNSLRDCLEDESLSVTVANDQLYVDEEKLPYSRTAKNLFHNIIRYFDARDLDGLRFGEQVRLVSTEQLLSFMRLLEISGQQPEPQTWLQEHLADEHIDWIELIQKTEGLQGEESIKSKAERREMAKRDYSYAKASIEEVAEKLKEGKRGVGVRKTVRVIQDTVTNLIEDDEVYAAISTLRVFDDYTYTHSVNVAMLSMCIGRRINLSRRNLVNLGISALFHDLGKIEIPNAVLFKKEKLDKDEVKMIQRHSLNSSRLMMRLKASAESKGRLLVPMFEHHLKYDLSGYPYANWKKPLTLFGKIISIADKYDTLTSARVYRKSLLSPDRALGYMFERAGKDYDPILMKVFINIMGIYPVGTLLQLDTGELALVVSSPSRDFSKRPLVSVLEKEEGGSYRNKEIINMDERDAETGKYLREIVDTHHPAEFGIQPVQHIFTTH